MAEKHATILLLTKQFKSLENILFKNAENVSTFFTAIFSSTFHRKHSHIDTF